MQTALKVNTIYKKVIIFMTPFILTFTALLLHQPLPTTLAQTTNQYGLSPAQAQVSTVTTMLDSTKEINYLPTNNGWEYMWSRWDPNQINTDFAKISSMGFNTVRIILQSDTAAFNYPYPSQTSLNELNQVITMANANNLKVHLTLFDWWSDYADISGSKIWANTIVAPYAGDPRISFIELQNEIDPNPLQMTWAKAMIPYLKSIDGGIPVTISEYDSDRMQELVTALAATPPDFYTYHTYSAPQFLYNELDGVKNMVKGIPLYIGESGYSTYSTNASDPNIPDVGQEANQEFYFRALYYATQGLGLPFAAPWIYSDFTTSASPTTMPLSEYYFGLFRTDGSAKPAASTMENILAGKPLDLSFNNGFEQVGDNGLPALWNVFQNAQLGYTANFKRDTTTSHTGTASAEISDSVNNNNGTPEFYITPVQYVTPGEIVSIGGWIKGLNATGQSNIALNWYDSSNNYISSTTTNNLPPGTSDWQPFTVTTIIPDNVAYYSIGLESSNNSGAVWFDDIEFNINPPPTPVVVDLPTDTYGSTINIAGIKDPSIAQVYVNYASRGVIVLDSTNWLDDNIPLSIGNNQITIYGEDILGNVSSIESVNVDRHILGDINGDGKVDIIDFSLLAYDWGNCGNQIKNPLADISDDGCVDIQDLSILASNFSL